MNLRWLVLFAAVAEANSFTRAAVKLNVAQPWMSAQIRQLEELIGVQLFERTKSGIKITDAGRELLPFAQKVAAGVDNFKERARALGEGRSHLLRLGSQISLFELSQIRQLNLSFQKKYPSCSVETKRNAPQELFDMLKHGVIDCVICYKPLEADLDSFEFLTLSTVQPYLLGTGSKPTPLKKLAGKTLTLPRIELTPDYHEAIHAALNALNIDIEIAPEAGIPAIKHHVRKGFGTVLMLTGTAADFADDTDLWADECDLPQTEIVLARFKKKEPPRAARQFWNLAKQSLTQEDAIIGLQA